VRATESQRDLGDHRRERDAEHDGAGTMKHGA
jgi:hypothetical protein